MPITELLERNAREFPKDIALVEINPEIQEKRRVTWRDYELIHIPRHIRHCMRRIITHSAVVNSLRRGKSSNCLSCDLIHALYPHSYTNRSTNEIYLQRLTFFVPSGTHKALTWKVPATSIPKQSNLQPPQPMQVRLQHKYDG